MNPTDNIELALTAIRHHFGAGSIQRLGSNEALAVETLSTGSLALEVALGAGGLPLGRIVEIYGPESSGKTTFCHAAASVPSLTLSMRSIPPGHAAAGCARKICWCPNRTRARTLSPSRNC